LNQLCNGRPEICEPESPQNINAISHKENANPVSWNGFQSETHRKHNGVKTIG
jgi:hypothetical protein